MLTLFRMDRGISSCYFHTPPVGRMASAPISGSHRGFSMPYVREISPEDRFWSKVEKTAFCWHWRGSISKWGYGKFFPSHRECVASHIYAYEQLRGDVPPGRAIQIDHLCRNRACVNPWHMELVTARINCWRGASPAAYNHAKTHCIRGHEFTPENTFSTKTHPNSRFCLTCRRIKGREYDAKRREQKLAAARARREAKRAAEQHATGTQASKYHEGRGA